MKAVIKVKNIPYAPAPTKRFRHNWEGDNPVPVSNIDPYHLLSPAAKAKKKTKKPIESLPEGKSTGERYEHGHSWTDEETTKLIELYNSGMVYADMPAVLKISFSAIKHKVELLQKQGVIEYRCKHNCEKRGR